MQVVTLTLHIIAIPIALHIIRKRWEWQYYGWMLLFSNFTGALFYVIVLLDLTPYGHELSQLRSLLLSIILLMFSVSIANGNGNTHA